MLTTTEYIFWTLVPLVTILQFINHWCIGHGKMYLSYRISMVSYSCYFVVESILALRDPTQRSIMVFNIVNAWAFFMAYKGYKRLKQTS